MIIRFWFNENNSHRVNPLTVFYNTKKKWMKMNEKWKTRENKSVKSWIVDGMNQIKEEFIL